MNKLYTDYPITELGDIAGQNAPVRLVDVLSYDDNKYCEVVVEGVRTSIKTGYIYTQPGRAGDVPVFCVKKHLLNRLEYSKYRKSLRKRKTVYVINTESEKHTHPSLKGALRAFNHVDAENSSLSQEIDQPLKNSSIPLLKRSNGEITVFCNNKGSFIIKTRHLIAYNLY